MQSNRSLLYHCCGSLFALSAVLLGAFGAHALKETLIAHDSVATWETAVRYQMWHALALLILPHCPQSQRIRRATGICFIVGIVLFSGSLYGLALDGPKWLGPITPLGGINFLCGWSLLVYSSFKSGSA
jgi:uncharacterized membrane protein YgdD (TMEM256/DUF423 family)